MASTINAKTTGVGGIEASGDASGVLQLQSNGTTIATISSTGFSTQVGAPTFRAFVGTNQSMAAGDTQYVAQLNTESFDTASCFNNTGSTVSGIPAYSFMPNVAGYYQVNAKVYINRASSNVYAICGILKNGSNYAIGTYVFSVAQIDSFSTCNDLVYLNGTTDYIQMYIQASNPSTVISGSNASAFSASLVRSA